MNEEEKTQAVSEDSMPVPEKDLEEVAGSGWIIIERIEPSDPPPEGGGTGGG
jgi:hypothetical protein